MFHLGPPFNRNSDTCDVLKGNEALLVMRNQNKCTDMLASNLACANILQPNAMQYNIYSCSRYPSTELDWDINFYLIWRWQFRYYSVVIVGFANNSVCAARKVNDFVQSWICIISRYQNNSWLIFQLLVCLGIWNSNRSEIILCERINSEVLGKYEKMFRHAGWLSNAFAPKLLFCGTCIILRASYFLSVSLAVTIVGSRNVRIFWGMGCRVEQVNAQKRFDCTVIPCS